MGAHPYWYFVEYQEDVQQALDELREREFQAGRYNPIVPFPEFPVDPEGPSPGARHGSIREVFQDTDADGTRSILDIFTVAEEPDFCSACPVHREELVSLYGTAQPTQEMVEQNMGFLEELERGHCVYLVTYRDQKPDKLFFAGYSFD